MNEVTTYGVPLYLLKHVEQAEQQLKMAQLLLQQAYNIAAAWLAEELGTDVQFIIENYEWSNGTLKFKEK